MDCDNSANLFLRSFVFLLGLIIIVPTMYKVYHYTTLRMHCSLTYGWVSRTGQGQYLGSRPYVTFSDANGVIHEVRSNVNYYFLFAPQIGKKLRVFYRESEPESALVDNWVHYILLPVIFLCLGGILIYSVVVNSFREKPKEHP